jgi:hypothetical protein
MMADTARVPSDTPIATPNWRVEDPVPDIHYLPPSPQRASEWGQWANKVMLHRLQVTLECNLPGEAGEEARKREETRVREYPMYLLATYGTIYEARSDVRDTDQDDMPSSAFIPFIPFPFQIRFGYWFLERLETKGTLGDGIGVKARDMGVSNETVFLCAALWATRVPFQARLLSRTEDLVDRSGDPDSMFWKLEYFLRALPGWLFQRLVPGFDWKKNRNVGRLTNPSNGNVISGESTQANAGRGGRATVIVYDEAAFMDNFGSIWTAGRDSTNHRIAISTVSTEKGLDFYNIHHGRAGYTQPSVILFHHWENPFHDDKWLERQRERDTDAGIRREIFMDYFAGISEWVYPEAGDKNPGHFPFEPGAGHLYLVGDDGFDDDFALVWVQFVNATGRFRVFQGYRNQHMPTGFYGSLIRGIPESKYHYGRKEFAVMSRQQLLPPQTYVFDSHIDSVEQITGQSPAEYLAQNYGIVPIFNFDPKARAFKNRRLKLGNLLPLMDFHDQDGAVEVLEAVQRTRFKQSKEGSDRMYEFKEPIHDKNSHFVSALEWFAINWDQVRYGAPGHDQISYLGEPHS